MSPYEEINRLNRLLGRCQYVLKCRKRGPPRRDRPPLADRSCRARMPNDRKVWCEICRLLGDIDEAPPS